MLRTRLIATQIADTSIRALKTWAGHRRTTNGATHWRLDTRASVDYINRVYDDYVRYGAITPGWLLGKSVLEIGFGDSLGVALRFLAGGAAQVTSIDAFAPVQNTAQQTRIYQMLRDQCDAAGRARFDEAVQFAPQLHFALHRLTALLNTSIEAAADRFLPCSFDLIVSRAVLMELPDPQPAFAAMDKLLRPGGKMIHSIAPLHDYGMFTSSAEHHPLEFLTISPAMYKMMAGISGKPNRKLASFYRNATDSLGYRSQAHIVRLTGSRTKFSPGVFDVQHDPGQYGHARALVDAIRPRLAQQFRSAAEEDLMIADLFLVAEKP